MLKNATLLLLSALMFSFSVEDEVHLHGKILDQMNEPILFATIALYKEGVLLTGCESDFDGNYSFNLDPGVYDLEVYATGYVAKKILDVPISDEPVVLDVLLEEQVTLDEITITAYKASSIKYDEVRRGYAAKASRATEGSLIKKRSAVMAMGDASRAKLSAHSVSAVATKKESAMAMDVEEEISAHASGTLTAGEWNDLSNWEEWKALCDDGVYQSMTNHWGLGGLQRHSVFVHNTEHLPLANQEVQLITDEGKLLWEATTDHHGTAELWAPDDTDHLKVTVGGSTFSLTSGKEASTTLSLTQPCTDKGGLDVMFVVDATGSMRDEINFLKAELTDVITRVHSDESLRIASLFYKDISDSYLMKYCPFKNDIADLMPFIHSKSAGGGGDFPEAVDLALAEALTKDWNPEATNRLLFLLLDAPPRNDAETLERLHSSLRLAAAMGIKIIPITGSGINRQTEYLTKQMALLTNATYVFLTDDSGVGHGHLAPVVSDYEVETLNDLLVRLIDNYSTPHNCESPTKQASHNASPLSVKLYPNPTAGTLQVDMDVAVDALVLRAASGRVILKLTDPASSERLDLTQYAAGIYQLSLMDDGAVIRTERIIKV